MAGEGRPAKGGIGPMVMFKDIRKTIGNNIHKYWAYPRIVSETDGNGFIFFHYFNIPIQGELQSLGDSISKVRMFSLIESLHSQVILSSDQRNSNQTDKQNKNGRPVRFL